jgi:parallel beta-helix repeat protein
VVTGNKIMRNRGDGIYIHEAGKGMFENNEIFQQKLDGIRTSKSSPTLVNNSIHNNDGDGVRIVINANPTVKGNRIFENNRVGIHVYRDGCGTCTDNHIYGNKNAGMQVYGGGCTEVVRNRIQYNRCTGVYISDRASVALKNNELSHNGDCGIEVVSGAQVTALEGNKIHHNKTAGMAAYVDTLNASAEVLNFLHSNGPDFHVPYSPDAMDTTGSECIPAPGDSANVLVREGRSCYPKLIKCEGHQPEIVSFLAERAIMSKLCTFTFTREYYHAQYWYECRTCSSPRQILGRSEVSEVSVCAQCARMCHFGHDLSPRKFGHFYCDCGQMAAKFCKCSMLE